MKEKSGIETCTCEGEAKRPGNVKVVPHVCILCKEDKSTRLVILCGSSFHPLQMVMVNPPNGPNQPNPSAKNG
jgi:hypothetical protein